MDSRKEDMALSDAELDRLFEASDAQAPLPSGDLMARILADAEAQASAPVAPMPASVVPAQSFLSRLRETLGGWGGVSGLAGVAAVGLIVGIFPPVALSDYAASVLGTDTSVTDYLPGLEAALGEVVIDG
ncbi:MAG: hypothetical protein AAGI10_07690 [Pseudomonadota bacterium]